MKPINNSQPILCNLEVYNSFFFDGECHVSTSIDMPFLYYLDSIAGDDDKIILFDEIQDSNLLEEGYVYDGNVKSNVDNLEHVFVKRYRLSTPDKNFIVTTEQSLIRDENCKYSHFLANKILELMYIDNFSFKNISKILESNYNLNIPTNRVCDIYNNYIEDFKLKKFEEVEDLIKSGEIKLGQVANYDEEFLYIKHQPYVRLTLIDFKSKLILKDIVIPRKLFNRDTIKNFIEETIGNLNYHTVVTDGDKRYKKILDELGLNQQRCIFHSMQNLMSRVNPVHNKLKRRIKKINEYISTKEKDLEVLKEKYAGCIGRPRKNDQQRKNDIKKMKELQNEISALKAEKREKRNYINKNNKYIKKISRMLKSGTYELGIKRFKELWTIKDELSDEIRKHLKNLKNYLHEALWHTLNKDVPRTNNLIESFYKATLPRKIKYIYVTYDGLMDRIMLADLRWTENTVRQKIKQPIHIK